MTSGLLQFKATSESTYCWHFVVILGMCFSLLIKTAPTETLFHCSVLSRIYCKHGMNFQLFTRRRKWYQLLKKKSKIGSLNIREQTLTFITSDYTYLLSTWRAVCDISVNFLWIIFIAVCIRVPRSNDSYNHTTLKTNKIKFFTIDQF
jgi:hypothetical protein